MNIAIALPFGVRNEVEHKSLGSLDGVISVPRLFDVDGMVCFLDDRYRSLLEPAIVEELEQKIRVFGRIIFFETRKYDGADAHYLFDFFYLLERKNQDKVLDYFKKVYGILYWDHEA